jgi:uncharacterized membrane protein YuzA (DUF378 family)
MENKLKSFLAGNPHYLGLFFALLGIAGLICAITDANWLFGDVNKMTYNLKKIDGWVNFFGRKPARVISGVISVIIILSGLFWFIAGSKRG